MAWSGAVQEKDVQGRCIERLGFTTGEWNHTLRDMATRMSMVEKTNNGRISKGVEQIKTHQLTAA